jgi:hypothetical protein
MRQIEALCDQNFDFAGALAKEDNEFIRLSYCGFRTLFVVNGQEGLVRQLIPLTLGGIAITTSLMTFGAAAIIEFTITNGVPYAQNVSVALEVDIMVETHDDAPVYDLGNGLGFRAVGDRAEFRFYARGHPLCSDVTSYWFGQYVAWLGNRWNQVTQSFYNGSDSAATLAWRNRTVPGGGRLVLRTVLTGGIGSQPPTLDLTGTTIPSSIHWETPITITGTAMDPENSPITVVAIFDLDATSSGTLVTLMPSGSQFTKTFTLESFNAATRGAHRLDVYAVDYSGMFSDARTFNIQVDAPTVGPTPSPGPTVTSARSNALASTPLPTATRTASPTPLASLTPYPHLLMYVGDSQVIGTSFRLEGRLEDP